jgi:hypothetical protein
MRFADSAHPTRLRLDRGWGLGWGIAMPDSRVIRWSLADHVVGVLGGEDAIVAILDRRMCRRKEAHRFFKPSTAA